MALTKCQDCGADVSDQAAACPQCARPMRGAAPRPSIWQDRNAGCFGCAVLILVVAFSVYFGVCSK